jgi:hypothetical protein
MERKPFVLNSILKGKCYGIKCPYFMTMREKRVGFASEDKAFLKSHAE